jgi:hypothetical protein
MKRLLLLSLFVLVGCPTDSPGDPSDPTPGVESVGPAASVKGDLKLKRWRQISRDLEGALALPPEAICNETGQYPCSTFHAVPLGGTSVENGLFRSVDTVSVTTGLTFERFVLSACWERLRRDLDPEEDAEAPVVFGHLPADGTKLDPDAAGRQVVDLYRRLLGRDPLPEETDAVVAMHAGIVEDGGTHAEWAVMACFAVGSTTEGLMY